MGIVQKLLTKEVYDLVESGRWLPRWVWPKKIMEARKGKSQGIQKR